MPVAHPQAKLNVTLAVGPRGRDGYHSLRSVFLRIGLCDELAIEQAPLEAGADSLIVSGLPGCPVADNIVLRAFAALRTATRLALPPLAAHLDKRIPLAAGLGGGSSDAAAALELAATSWGVGVGPVERLRLAIGLGSDVPFFSAAMPAALVAGRGEHTARLPALLSEPGILLAVSPTPLSTRAVFERFDELAPTTADAGPITDDLAAALRGGLEAAALVDRLGDLRDANQLWPAAAHLQPDLIARRAGLEAETGRPWLLTGSGPTLFTLYPSVEAARAARRRLQGWASRAGIDTKFLATGTALASPDRR